MIEKKQKLCITNSSCSEHVAFLWSDYLQQVLKSASSSSISHYCLPTLIDPPSYMMTEVHPKHLLYHPDEDLHHQAKPSCWKIQIWC